MEQLLIFIVCVAIVIWISKSRARKQISKPTTAIRQRNATGQKKLRVPAWLEERWAAAMEAQASGDFANFPAWYFDPATDYQLAALAEDGKSFSPMEITKGQASDLIGLDEPPSLKQRKMAEFFKLPGTGKLNETLAKETIRLAFASAENLEKWSNRGPDPEQRALLACLGIKTPRTLTFTKAEEMLATIFAENQAAEELFCELEEAWEEICDPEYREDMSLKKPSPNQFAMAAKDVRAENKEISSDSIAEKLVEIYPALERD